MKKLVKHYKKSLMHIGFNKRKGIIVKTFKQTIESLDCSGDIPFGAGSGLIVFNSDSEEFYRIKFGNGTNLGSRCDDDYDYDDYMYLEVDEYDDSGDFQEDIDGGQMDINQAEWTGYLNEWKLVKACIEFLGCLDPSKCILIKKF